MSLPFDARAELTDRLVANSTEAIPPQIEHTHLAELRERIRRVEAGEVRLIPGEQVMAEGRALLASLSAERLLRF